MASNMENILLHNARIWCSKDKPETTWLTFSSSTGYVTAVGAGEPEVERFPPSMRIDAGGRRVLPGLHESHIHVSHLGRMLSVLQLRGCNTLDQLQRSLQEQLQEHMSRWVVGTFEALDAPPHRDFLDAVCPDKPLVLLHANMHWLAVNSQALKAADISECTACPSGGVIESYPRDHPQAGKLNGVLKEAAMSLIVDKIDEGEEVRKEQIVKALDYCMMQGVTAVHTNEPGTWREFCELAETNRLNIRVFYVNYFSHRHTGNFPSRAGESRGRLLSCDRVKLFTDGALGCDTAALSQPYVGTCNHGVLLYNQDSFDAEVAEATSRGFRLEIHVIGDAAADMALNALEKEGVTPEKRPILTHCQILREEHIERMQARGVIANIQPQFVVTDTRWLHQRLPEKLTTHAYAWKTLMNAGITCAGGSDAPVEEPKPLLGIYDAIYRQMETRDPENMQVYRPDECYSFDEAVHLYTRNGAYTTLREQDLGQLRVGYYADFILLDSRSDVRDSPRDLLAATVHQVYVAGKKTYHRH